MTKEQIISCPDYFKTYISYTEGDLLTELISKTPSVIFADIENLKQLKDQVYSPNKWTIKQIIQHCIDTERIMAYRALRISRGDLTQLPGFDESEYAFSASVSKRTIDDLMEEFEAVRKSTIYLFQSLEPKNYKHIGRVSEQEVCPLALGFIIIGHPMHHLKVIKERYFPLLQK